MNFMKPETNGRSHKVSMEQRIEVHERVAKKIFGSINWGEFAQNSQVHPEAAERLAAYRRDHEWVVPDSKTREASQADSGTDE